MKQIFLFLIAVMLMAGCATRSTIASRRQERLPAYNALPPDQKEAADHGQLKVGMTEDAVYVAWGAPDQILHSENAAGSATTWVFMGQWMEETRYWSRRGFVGRQYNPRSYVRAEVVFQNGKLASWQTLPQPVY